MRSMFETAIYVHNPLPDVPESQLLKLAKLDELMEPAKRSPFIMQLRYSGGAEREFMDLKPGEERLVPISAAAAFVDANAELGAVRYPADADEAAKIHSRIIGVQRAIKFWQERGLKRLAAYRKTHGITQEEMEDFRYELWAYHLAAARARVLEDHLKSLRRQQTALAKIADDGDKE
jgi:hypothetical protein